jgi:hypothetical protein
MENPMEPIRDRNKIKEIKDKLINLFVSGVRR